MLTSEIPIGKTKITLPKRRAELLSRGRLLNILYERLDRKLIIISAAAGYGKTSLLIDLAHHSELPFCWLALDLLDREPQHFIAGFIAALSERFPQFGARSRSVLDGLTSLEEGMERLLVTLVNEIYDDIQEHFVLVLDDFHMLDECGPVLYFINRFVQLVGENCHLIFASRTLPELSDIPLLVAREEVGGLDFSDLSFRPEEIQALLAQNQDTHLSDEEARRLADLTEGWITGLQFADLRQLAQGKEPFRPSHGIGITVFDYLGQQVLEQQPAALRTFMLRTSLLEEFDASLCETVLGPLYPAPQDWSRLLDTIVQKNLFALPVGTNGQWLRYHHLFSDYLQNRFRKEYPAEEKPILQRLATYHETHGEWAKAYQLYKQLGDQDILADMIERAGIPMYRHARLMLESWLKALPPSLLNKRPGLLSLRGNIETIKGNGSEAIQIFDRAIADYRARADLPGLALTLARRGSTHRFLGNYSQALQDANEAMGIAAQADNLQWIYADALHVRGNSLYRQGYALQAIKDLEEALDIYVGVNDSAMAAQLLMETAMTYSTVGNYAEAKSSYGRALKVSREDGNLTLQASLLNNYGVFYQQQGEYEQAAQALEEGLLCAQRSGYRRMEALISLSLGDLYSEVEDFELAEQNYSRVRDLIQQLQERFLTNYSALADANLALLQRERQRARLILERAVDSIRAGGSNYENSSWRFLKGRLSLQEGQPRQALESLTEAKRGFVQDGREMESTWCRVWLAAAYYQHGEHDQAREEIRATVRGRNLASHSAAVAGRQARDWLGGLLSEPEVKPQLRPFIEAISRLEDHLPRLRRQLRRLARSIEVPLPKLVIRAFGPGQVWVNGKPISAAEWQTQSVRELFFYFLSENRPLTKERIAETLWSNTIEPAKQRLRFKNEIYRLRRAVGHDTILFDGEYYQFNPAVDHEYDVEAFEAYLTLAKTATNPRDQINFYQKAVDTVQGTYLEDFGSSWIVPDQERLRQTFLSAALTLAELCFREGQTERAIQTCRQILTEDGTFEAACRLLMQIFHRLGDRASIVHTYQACEQNMQSVFGLPASAETQELYRQLMA